MSKNSKRKTGSILMLEPDPFLINLTISYLIILSFYTSLILYLDVAQVL